MMTSAQMYTVDSDKDNGAVIRKKAKMLHGKS